MSQIFTLFIFLFTGWFTFWLTLRMKVPFTRLAVASVQLLDALLLRDKTDEFAQLLEQRVKSALMGLLVFVLFSFLVILPTILIFNSVLYNSNVIPSTFYAIGSLLPFLYISYFQNKTSDYSYLSQLLHRLVLNNYELGHWLLLRQIRKVTVESAINQKSVIITGLARAGTTALTQAIAKNGNFASLDYSNMPFLLYPRLWKYFYKPQNKKEKERAHKDGVTLGLSSVEALEEYFFKVISSDSYLSKEGLVPYQVDSWILYKRYQTSIAGGRTYLSKNNNHILRITNLIQDKNTFVFVLFRKPLEHADSLLQQHNLFCQLQKNDPFTLEYMNWLGHHEFGLNNKPFLLNNTQTKSIFNLESIEYWLERWTDYYSYILNFSGVTFLSYEQFLANPESTLNFISDLTNNSIDTFNLTKFSKQNKQICCENKDLLRKADQIYKILLEKSTRL